MAAASHGAVEALASGITRAVAVAVAIKASFVS
jgi:hypothetical protein